MGRRLGGKEVKWDQNLPNYFSSRFTNTKTKRKICFVEVPIRKKNKAHTSIA